MSNIINITLDYAEDIDAVISSKYPEVKDFRILSKALDARRANKGRRPKYTYRLEVIKDGEEFSSSHEILGTADSFSEKPIIIGAGPAGLFCALRLIDYGIPSIIIERGESANNRMKHIAKFWRYGQFNEESNVCYGEGGAGLFSDGKLITRIKSPYVKYVMNRLVDFGAPEETAYLSNPHLGSNKIRVLITEISRYLIEKGCEIHYNTRVDELLTASGSKTITGVKTNDGNQLYSSHIVLATGHSAKEMYHHLNDLGVDMKAKDFSIGVRIEHPRRYMDQLQYGQFCGVELGAARYRLSYENPKTKKGTYSFCMCPGGYVLSSGTEADGIVVNGMSNFARNSPWSNAALVVSVENEKDFEGHKNVLAGLEFQQNVERKAYEVSKFQATGRELPAQRLTDFLSKKLSSGELPKSSTPSGLTSSNLFDILPSFVTDHLQTALLEFDKKMSGFVSDNSLLIAPETRTSAPITINRDKITLESTNFKGLYPCGEGAGHAGGITSAAVDGIKVAMSIMGLERKGR